MNIFNAIKSNLNKIKSFLGGSGSTVGSWALASPDEWDRRTLITKYERYVYPIISSIAENAAKVELVVKKVSARGKETILPNHPFLQILRKPNADWSKFQFLEMHFTFMKLCGESFWYIAKGEKTKVPREFYLLRPDLMQVLVDPNSPVGAVGGYILRLQNGQTQAFNKDEILHFKMPNPENAYRGKGPVQAGKVYIETENHSSKWKLFSVYNSGRPSGIVQIGGQMNNDQFKIFKKEFNSQINGVENTGKTLFIKGADSLKYEKLSMDLNEVALRALRDLSLEDIMIMFRANKTILGISDDVNRANADANREVFIQNLIIPELDRFVEHIDAFFIDTFSEDVTLTYKNPRTKTDKEIDETIKNNLYKCMTVNEARALKGLEPDPSPGANKLYIPVNLVPLNTEDTPPEDNNKALKKKVVEPVKKKEDETPKASPNVIARAENFRTQLYNVQAAWEKKVEGLIVDEFTTQQKEIVNHVKSLKGNGLKKKELEEWLFDVNKANNRIVGSLTPALLELVIEQAKLALDLADDNETEFRITDEIKRYINERLNKMADGTNNLTIEKLKESLSEGILNGESVNKLIKRVEEIYTQAKGVRAEMIARTETIAASNAGAEEAYRQSPVVTYKEWFANPGACEFCVSLNGKVVGISTDFLKLGDAVTSESGATYNVDYEDVGHPPLHPDCRCTILPVRQS